MCDTEQKVTGPPAFAEAALARDTAGGLFLSQVVPPGMCARPRRQRRLAVLLATVLALAAVTAALPATAAASPAAATAVSGSTNATGGAETTATTQADTTIDATARVGLTPADPGTVRVTLGFDVPTQVTNLVVTLPPDATVTSTDGFGRTSDGYEWDGDGAPSLTYDLEVNRSERVEGPLTGRGQYSFVDAGRWALIRRPGFGARWEWRGTPDVTLVRSVEPAGSGAVGDSMLYLGPHEEHVRQAHGQRFRLVVPAAARMRVGPDAILGSLASASDELRVGDRDDEVFAVAAPTDSVGWTARGLQTGESDFWVRDEEPLSTPENVWLHEYVHTRQDFSNDADASVRWLTEGMANYYAAMLSVENGEISFESFSRELARGTGATYGDSILAAPETWARYTDYEKGSLVTGELDRRIRLASGRVNDFENVWAQLNSAEGSVDHQTLRDAIATTTNESVATRLSDLVTTRATPEMWSRAEHRAAFGPTPALFRTRVPALDTSYRVSGPYRNRSVDRVPTLVPGETLAFTVGIENVGGQTGAYTVPVTRGDATVTTLSGSLDGRSSANRTVEYTVAETGRWTVSAGDSSFLLSATDPARPTVASVATDPASPTAGIETVIVATVRNDASVPGERTLRFTVDDRPVANRTVNLDAGSTREVAVSTALDAGSHRVAVGNVSATVEVASEPTATEESEGNGGAGAGTSTGTGPGFAVSGALGALAALSLLARRRR